MKVKAKILTGLLGGALFALPIAGFSSCELVREDLAECPEPIVELRFVFEYNMEFANSFHNQVDCLSVCFFNSDGELVAVESVTDRAILADENYRMTPALDEGRYHVVAYGGMCCENASFSHVDGLNLGMDLTEMHVQLDRDCLTDRERARLHNLYYGAADLTVDGVNDSAATVAMMRNTNSVQVALQHMNGSPIDVDQFIFEILDDNDDFDYENNLLATGEITYIPWNTENRSTGTVATETSRADDDEPQEWAAAVAHFSTSRLVARKQTSATLRVRRAEDGETLFRVPLINYMLLFKNDNTAAGLYSMDNQEYLDRENSWRFVFFLDENKGDAWINSRIIVNDWEVRMNDTDF